MLRVFALSCSTSVLLDFFCRHTGAALDPQTDAMSALRWTAGLTIAVIVGTAAFGGSATAAASSADDTYLAQMRATGFEWAPEHDTAIIGMGHLICDDLYWGWQPERIARDIHANLDGRNVQFGQVTSMVNIARANYCNW